MDFRYQTTSEALNAILGEFGLDADVARYLGVNQGLISIYRKSGRIRPTLRDALEEKYPYLKNPRIRFSGDIPEWMRREIREYFLSIRVGMTNGEMLELMWLFWKNFHDDRSTIDAE